jgi:hypothetical protein
MGQALVLIRAERPTAGHTLQREQSTSSADNDLGFATRESREKIEFMRTVLADRASVEYSVLPSRSISYS